VKPTRKQLYQYERQYLNQGWQFNSPIYHHLHLKQSYIFKKSINKYVNEINRWMDGHPSIENIIMNRLDEIELNFLKVILVDC